MIENLNTRPSFHGKLGLYAKIIPLNYNNLTGN
jgi:hypothetical protein